MALVRAASAFAVLSGLGLWLIISVAPLYSRARELPGEGTAQLLRQDPLMNARYHGRAEECSSTLDVSTLCILSDSIVWEAVVISFGQKQFGPPKTKRVLAAAGPGPRIKQGPEGHPRERGSQFPSTPRGNGSANFVSAKSARNALKCIYRRAVNVCFPSEVAGSVRSLHII